MSSSERSKGVRAIARGQAHLVPPHGHVTRKGISEARPEPEARSIRGTVDPHLHRRSERALGAAGYFLMPSFAIL